MIFLIKAKLPLESGIIVLATTAVAAIAAAG
jgi:hypothetical protein